MKRKKLSLLTRPEMEQIIDQANFTDLQTTIFRMLCRDLSDIHIMIELYLSNRKFYTEKALIYLKVQRLMLGFGTNYGTPILV